MRWFYLAFLVSFLFSCQKGEELRPYYYNLSDYFSPKIQVFTSPDDPNFIHYWKIWSDEERQELHTEFYDENILLTEYFVEEYGEDGSIVTKFRTLFEGELIDAIIEKDAVYGWTDNGKLSYSATIGSGNGSGKLNKSREFISFENIDVDGAETMAAKFKGQLVYQTKYGDPYGFWQNSWYTKEQGLVKLTRHFENETFTMELNEVLNEDDWNEVVLEITVTPNPIDSTTYYLENKQNFLRLSDTLSNEEHLSEYFSYYVSKGDYAYENGNYEIALEAYQEAAQLRSANSIREKIAEIQSTLSN